MDAHERQALTEQLPIYEALLLGLDRRHAVVDAIWDARGAGEAMDRLRELLDVDELGARVILDMQVRRLTAESRQRIADELQRLRALLSGE